MNIDNASVYVDDDGSRGGVFPPQNTWGYNKFPVWGMIMRRSLQGGTPQYDKFEAADTAIDGSIVVAGFTCGNWTGTKNISGDDLCDFAAMAIDAKGTPLWSYQVKALGMPRSS